MHHEDGAPCAPDHVLCGGPEDRQVHGVAAPHAHDDEVGVSLLRHAQDLAPRAAAHDFLPPEPDPPEACVVAERIRDLMASLRLDLPGRNATAAAVGLTVSIGVASWPEVPANRLEDLLAAADGALYRAKTLGRDRCERA